MAVTVAEPWMLRTNGRGRGGLRRATKAGHAAIATAPTAVQTRCCGGSVARFRRRGDADTRHAGHRTHDAGGAPQAS